MNRRTTLYGATLLIASLAVAQCDRAVGLSIFDSGSFVHDNDKVIIPFAWPGGHAYIHSLGAAGGVNSQGGVIAGGGFDPIISLFDSAGYVIASSDDFFGLDSYISLPLAPDVYTAVLTQWNNYPETGFLGDGFFHDSNPNFATGFYGLQPTWAIDIATSSPWTIAHAKSMGIGPTVYIEDAVVTNTIDLISSAASASFQIQDATGGLTVFGSNAVINGAISGFSEGQGMTLSGQFTQFSGLLELTPQFAGLGVGTLPSVAARHVSTTDLQDESVLAESLESSLVRLTNVRFVGIAPGQRFAGLTNYTVTDGISTASVRVPTGQLGMVGQLIPTGQLNLRGVLSQFDSTSPFTSGYQVLLTRPSDIRPVPEPTSLVAALAVAACGLTARRRRNNW